VLSSLVPAVEAMRVQPVETLRTGSFVPRAPRRGRLGRADVLALVLFAAAAALPRVPVLAGVPVGGYAAGVALLFGTALLTPRAVALVHRLVTPLLTRLIGVEARLASDNLRRDLGRASVTTGALMVGVAMTVSVAIFLGSFVHSTMAWVDQTIPADLHITSGSRFSGVRSVAMEDRLSPELSALPEVDGLEHIRIVDLDFRGLPIKLLSTDAGVFVKHAHFILLEGDEPAANAGFVGGGAMVSENLARRFGLHVGDTILLPARGGQVPLRVAGVKIDYTSDQGTITIDRELYARLYDDRRVDTYKLYLKPGSDAEAVRRVVSERWGERYNLFVLTYKEFKAGIISLLDQVFGIMHALELVAIVIAVLGVVNALLASVLDRVREIGVLRAIGMRRRQVRLMVMAEGGLVGLCAVLLGLGAGLVLGELLLAVVNLAQSGWYFPYHPPWLEIAQACGVVVVVAVLAGWYPARAAARLVVVEALEYE
jgi:putative ABC transport system permease protein